MGALLSAWHGNASIVSNDQVVFNIGGNRIRLVVRFDYPHQIGLVRFVRTPSDYDAVDPVERVWEIDMHVKPIKSEADYDAALAMIDGLMGAAPATPAGDELELLVTLVEAYEAAR